MFTVLAMVAELHVDQFNVHRLASTAWAFASAGRFDGSLFGVLARVTEQRVSDINAQDLANTAWAFVIAI